jgi:deazaflavin-dependent oxidoreductase (nitroreductase family)
MSTHTSLARTVPRYVTLFSPILRSMLGRGLPIGPNALVTILGRTSGQPRTTPLAIIEHDGRRWVWSPWGETQWVRNLRAAGRATISQRGREGEVRARELDAVERIAFFREVLGPVARAMRGGLTFVRLIDQVDLADPVEAADGRVVFELQPL